MATIQVINVSNPDDGYGDNLRDGGVKINSNFANLNNALVSAEVDISANTTNIGINASNITAANGLISVNTSDIAANAAAILANTSSIDQNTSDIATNTSDITTNAVRIDEVAADLANLEQTATGVEIRTNITDIVAYGGDTGDSGYIVMRASYDKYGATQEFTLTEPTKLSAIKLQMSSGNSYSSTNMVLDIFAGTFTAGDIVGLKSDNLLTSPLYRQAGLVLYTLSTEYITYNLEATTELPAGDYWFAFYDSSYTFEEQATEPTIPSTGWQLGRNDGLYTSDINAGKSGELKWDGTTGTSVVVSGTFTEPTLYFELITEEAANRVTTSSTGIEVVGRQLDINSGVATGVVTVEDVVDVLGTDEDLYVEIKSTTTATSYKLPAISASNDGNIKTIKAVDITNGVSISATGSDNINITGTPASSFAFDVADGQAVVLRANNTTKTWDALNEYKTVNGEQVWHEGNDTTLAKTDQANTFAESQKLVKAPYSFAGAVVLSGGSEPIGYSLPAYSSVMVHVSAGSAGGFKANSSLFAASFATSAGSSAIMTSVTSGAGIAPTLSISISAIGELTLNSDKDATYSVSILLLSAVV